MAYTVPIFNLESDVWYSGKTPADDDPDSENLPTQKYIYSRAVYDVQPCEMEQFTPPIFLRMSIDDIAIWQQGQIFECPAESGLYYRARFKEHMHQGFPNQYLVAVVVQCNSAGVPLIRYIENAVPCGGGEPAGEGEIGAELGLELEGEGTAGWDTDIVGAGQIQGQINEDLEGSGTQS